MATKRRTAAREAAASEATAAEVAPKRLIVVPEPTASPDPFAIGPASPAGTPGFYMGIGANPETPAEHAVRLGADAGQFNDAGFVMGTLEPRPEWPGQPAP